MASEEQKLIREEAGMRNKEYPYENVTQIEDLKEMILKKAHDIPDKTAFIYPCESGEKASDGLGQQPAFRQS